jgi:ABC-type sulfate/molybdate transport systems ATPase subunit
VASSPRLLLLDEPLSSLDADTARGLRREIRRFQRDLSITTLLVTHNLQEAAELGDRIAEVRAGAILRTTETSAAPPASPTAS